jgi:hypothetical protein
MLRSGLPFSADQHGTIELPPADRGCHAGSSRIFCVRTVAVSTDGSLPCAQKLRSKVVSDRSRWSGYHGIETALFAVATTDLALLGDLLQPIAPHKRACICEFLQPRIKETA